jgi:hypothetical protein
MTFSFKTGRRLTQGDETMTLRESLAMLRLVWKEQGFRTMVKVLIALSKGK